MAKAVKVTVTIGDRTYDVKPDSFEINYTGEKSGEISLDGEFTRKNDTPENPHPHLTCMCHDVPEIESKPSPLFKPMIKLTEADDMSLIQKLKNLEKSDDTKLLEKYGIIYEDDGELTCEGEYLLLEHLFEEHKSEIVEKLKKLDEEEKK